MSQPTEAQVRKFEFDHNAQFAYLVLANQLWLSLPGKYGFDPKKTNTKQYAAWYKMGKKIAELAGKWGERQIKLENIKDSKVPKVSQYLKNFLKPGAPAKELSDVALKLVKIDKGATGLGFIPLIIWAVIAIVTAVSAAYIIDETTTTAQEKQELMKTTETTLKELNIPPDKAAEIIQNTQQQASQNTGLLNSLTGGNSSLILIALAFFLFTSKNQKST